MDSETSKDFPVSNGMHEIPLGADNHLPPKYWPEPTNNNNVESGKCAEGESKVEHSKWRSALPQIFASSAKNMLLLTYGATIGLPTIAIPALSSSVDTTRDPYLSLTRSQISWFSSINLICVPLGCLLSGALTQPFGRKRSMLFLNIPFMIAFLLFSYASDVFTLYLALILCGFTGGLMEAPVLTYVAEITQPNFRGILSAVASMAVLLGWVGQLLLGSCLQWRTVALINVAYPIFSAIILCFIPESPHWLITKNRLVDAEKSLCWLRGWVKPSEIQPELKQITKSIQDSALKRVGKDGNKKPNYKMYTRRTFFLPYFIVTTVFFIGQVGGLTTLLTYAVVIFESLDTPINPFIAALLLGLVQMLGAFMCVVLVHYTGKRPLTLISTAGAGTCMIIVALYAQMHVTYGFDAPYIPLVFVLMFGFLTYLSVRLLPWMLIGEVFPNNIRSTASGATASSNYIFGFTINKLYYPMRDLFNVHGMFYFYGVINLLGCFVLYKMLPETEGRTLFDIEEHFADKSKTFDTHVVRTDKLKSKKKTYAADNQAMEKDENP